MSDFEFVLVHGNDFNLQTEVFEFVIGGGRGASGRGVPTGGTEDQILQKASGDDYDTRWVTQPSADSSVEGQTIESGVGVVGKAYYLTTTAATWLFADKGTEATVSGQVGVCSASGTIMFAGLIPLPAHGLGVNGKKLFVSSSGDISTTNAVNGEFSKQIGFIEDSDTIRIQIDELYIEMGQALPVVGVPAGGVAGDSLIKASPADFDFAILKNNLAAVIAPSVTNDSSEGYAIHSRWTDLATAKVYECVDASVGAAVWVDLTGGGGGGLYELVETVVLSGNADEIFDVNGEDELMFLLEGINATSTTNLHFRMSYDNGATYPSKHEVFQQIRDDNNVETLVQYTAYALCYLTFANGLWFNGHIKFHSLQSSVGRAMFESKLNYNVNISTGYRSNTEGWNSTSGTVTNIKIASLANCTGKIHMLRRTL